MWHQWSEHSVWHLEDEVAKKSRFSPKVFTAQSPLKSSLFPLWLLSKTSRSQARFLISHRFMLALKRLRTLSRTRKPCLSIGITASTWAEKWSLMTLKQCRHWETTAPATKSAVESIFDKFNCQENCSEDLQLTVLNTHFTITRLNACAQSGNSKSRREHEKVPNEQHYLSNWIVNYDNSKIKWNETIAITAWRERHEECVRLLLTSRKRSS